MAQIKTFVINLKRSEDRRQYIKNALNLLGLQYQFIEAIDGAKMSEQTHYEIKQRSKNLTKKHPYRSPITKEEAGCALSHLKVYEKIVKENIDYACILEDDIKITHPENLKCILEKDNLLRLNKKVPFDFIYLYLTLYPPSFLFSFIPSNSFYARLGKTTIKDGFFLRKPCVYFDGTVGYIINQKSADVLLKEGLPVRKLADSLTGCSELWGLKQYFLTPPPITLEENLKSTIHKHELNVEQAKQKKWNFLRKIVSITLRPSVAVGLLRITMIFLLQKVGIISLKRIAKQHFY